MVSLLLISLFVFIAFNIPIAFSIGLSSLVFLLANDMPTSLLAQRTIQGMWSYPFLALPFFVYAGILMEHGGITARLMRLASAFVGHIRGGLAAVTVVGSCLFGALSGSGVGDTAAIGSIMIPAMKKKGYAADFAAALQGCAGTLASLIPPSLTIVIIGAAGGISIGGLLIGGLGPGIVTMICLITVSYIISRKRGYGGQSRATAKEIAEAVKEAILPLMTPVIILGGILSGIVTVTEAAVLAVAYSFLLSVVIYREVKLADLGRITLKAAMISVSIMIIVGFAGLFGWIMTSQRIPLLVTEFFVSIAPNKWMFLILINALLLVLGTFMESTALVLILIPVLMPVVNAYGLDPIHFGIVFLLNLTIGANTPPLGVTLMTAAKIAGVSFTQASRAVWPFIIAMISALIVTMFVPAFSTYLPYLILGAK